MPPEILDLIRKELQRRFGDDESTPQAQETMRQIIDDPDFRNKFIDEAQHGTPGGWFPGGSGFHTPMQLGLAGASLAPLFASLGPLGAAAGLVGYGGLAAYGASGLAEARSRQKAGLPNTGALVGGEGFGQSGMAALDFLPVGVASDIRRASPLWKSNFMRNLGMKSADTAGAGATKTTETFMPERSPDYAQPGGPPQWQTFQDMADFDPTSPRVSLSDTERKAGFGYGRPGQTPEDAKAAAAARDEAGQRGTRPGTPVAARRGPVTGRSLRGPEVKATPEQAARRRKIDQKQQFQREEGPLSWKYDPRYKSVRDVSKTELRPASGGGEGYARLLTEMRKVAGEVPGSVRTLERGDAGGAFDSWRSSRFPWTEHRSKAPTLDRPLGPGNEAGAREAALLRTIDELPGGADARKALNLPDVSPEGLGIERGRLPSTPGKPPINPVTGKPLTIEERAREAQDRFSPLSREEQAIAQGRFLDRSGQPIPTPEMREGRVLTRKQFSKQQRDRETGQGNLGPISQSQQVKDMPGAPADSLRARIEGVEADKNVAQFDAIDARLHVDLERAALGDLYKQADEMDRLNMEKYYAIARRGDNSPDATAAMEALEDSSDVMKEFANKWGDIKNITEEFGLREEFLGDIFPGLERTYEKTRKGLKRSQAGPKLKKGDRDPRHS